MKECVANVEDELQKRIREIQMVTEAGEMGKDLHQQTVVEVGGEMDKNQVMENNESVCGPVLENPFEEVDGQIRWAVHEGEQVMESLRTGNQDIGARTGLGASWDIKGTPQSSQARQVWLKLSGKTEAVDLGEETGEEMEEKVRRWMKAEKGLGLYVICEGRRLSWGDLAESWEMGRRQR